jgi:hypothetical protein
MSWPASSVRLSPRVSRMMPSLSRLLGYTRDLLGGLDRFAH